MGAELFWELFFFLQELFFFLWFQVEVSINSPKKYPSTRPVETVPKKNRELDTLPTGLDGGSTWMAPSLSPNFRAALGNGLRRFQHVKDRKFRNGIKIPNINL